MTGGGTMILTVGCMRILGSNSQCVQLTHLLELQDDELHWHDYVSPGQCYNNSVSPSRHSLRFTFDPCSKTQQQLDRNRICSQQETHQ